ncbi:MAG: DUF72 domain-containing protein [Gemmatimonadales bacterium]|nr:DUF72 domain-containing protein [Gemmatimonadales bacterium]
MDAPNATGTAELIRLRAAIPEGVHLGTTTWNYPGWRGIVYSRDYPAKGAGAEMLAEYARHPLFGTVGIDSSFYAPLTEKTLKSYADALPPGFRCISKVWDRITVKTFAKPRDQARAGEPNPDFLNADLFVREVWDPCRKHFAEHLGPFVFEFQTIAGREKIGPREFAERLDMFFGKLPTEGRYAVEARNAEFLTPAYFAVLRGHDVAHVFNSWTRMPSIGMQLDLPGSVSAGFLVARALLTPGRSYEAALNAFKPYDRIREPNPALRRDLVRVIETAKRLRIPAYVLVGNRAEGNSPLTIRAVVEQLAGGPPGESAA